MNTEREALAAHIASLMDGDYDDGLDRLVSASADGPTLVVRLYNADVGEETIYFARVQEKEPTSGLSS